MKIVDALQGVTHIFLDSAPVIYYAEKHPVYFALAGEFFNRIDAGTLMAVTSPITLAECLIHPLRLGLVNLAQDYLELVTAARNTRFFLIDGNMASEAAALRVRYNLHLLDAIQVAVALSASCEALLTNDSTLRRVTELNVLVLGDMEL